jgi:hypothetical protein
MPECTILQDGGSTSLASGKRLVVGQHNMLAISVFVPWISRSDQGINYEEE